MNTAAPQTITADTTIDDVVRLHSTTAQVFIHRRMHCVRCEIDRFHTLADACRIYGQPLESFIFELRASAGTGTSPVQRRTRAGCRGDRTELPELWEWAERIRAVPFAAASIDEADERATSTQSRFAI